FTVEAANTERIAQDFIDDPFIVIPKVHPEWTSEALLVQEHIDGIPGTDLAAIDAAGLDKKVLAARGAEAILHMILVEGIFHADPALMFKALITMEGLGRQYDPDFHIIEHLTPLLRKALRERYRPDRLLQNGRSAVAEFLSVAGSVPRDIARLLREARRGKTRI